MDIAGLALKILVSTLVVVLSFLCLGLYLRGRAPSSIQKGAIKLRARLTLAQGAELVLVEAAGRLYLIGLSSKGFELIDNLGEEGAELLSREFAQDERFEHGLRRIGGGDEVLAQLLRLDALRERGRGDR